MCVRQPEPDIFRRACELLYVLPEEAYAIEDSYNGIRAASRAGMVPIMVPDLMPPTDKMKELSEIILKSLTEVKVFIESSLEESR